MLSVLVWAAYILFLGLPVAGWMVGTQLRQPMLAFIDALDAQTRRVDLRSGAEDLRSLLDPPADGDVVGGAVAAFFAANQDGQHFTGAHPARRFVNEELLAAAVPRLRWFEVAPNMFVGVGLLATFALLAASITIAGTSLEGDAQRTAAAMGALLGTAGAKFLASIGGILASLGLIWDRTRLFEHADAALEGLARALERAVPPLPDASTREVVDALLDQRDIARRIDLRMETADELREASLARAMGAALEPMARSVADMGRTVAATNEQTMSAMVEAFSRELGAATARHNRDLAAILESTALALQAAPERLRDATSAMAEAIDHARDRLVGATQASNAALDATAGRLEAVADAASRAEAALSERLDRVVAEANATVSRLAEVASGAERAAAGIASVTTAMGVAAAAVQTAGAAVATAGAEARAASVEARDAAAVITATARLARDASDAIVGDVRQWTEGMAEVDGRVGGILDRLAAHAAPPAPDAVNDAEPPADTADAPPDVRSPAP